YVIRPWKSYQARFVKLYSRYLKTAAGGEADVEKQIKASDDYKQLDDAFQEVRSHIGSLTYQIEVTHSESTKNSLRKEIAELRAEKHDVALPGEAQKRSMDFQAMSDLLQSMKDEKSKLLQQRVDLMKQATDLRVKRDLYLSDRIAEASTSTIAAVQ